MKAQVTNHAAVRYAERIAGKDSKLDVNTYVVQNIDKINNDVNNMLDHSTLLYCGKVGPKNNNIINVFLSGTWVLFLDENKDKVITLYKVDFNVGEDFNKQFVSKICERIETHKKELEELKEKVAGQRDSYLQIIEDNKLQINEYKEAIKNLEDLNSDYQDIIKKMDAEYLSSEIVIRKDIEDLVMKKEF